MPLSVSIVTPSYNHGAYVERAIASVLGQGAPALELVVVDGNSTDDTLSVVQRHGPSLRWVSEPDNGQAHAVNKGLSATSGDVIGWLNSDDVYYPGAVRAACEVFETHPRVDVVYGEANHTDVEDRPIGRYPTEPWSLPRLRDVCFICQPTVFIRRQVIDRHGLLDERLRYCLDYEYWLRLGLGGATFHYLARLQAASRVHPLSKTALARLESCRETLDMLRRTLGRVPDAWLFNYAHVLVEERGFTRDRPLRFALAIVSETSAAALRWNHRLSPSLIGRMGRWAAGHTRPRLVHALRR